MTFLKKLAAVLAVSLPVAASAQTAAPAPAKPALTFKLSGDLNHQIGVWNNQAAGFFRSSQSETIGLGRSILQDTTEDSYINFKYRLTFETSTPENAIRGVYGIEIGGIRFGDGGTKAVSGDAIGTNGGAYSGDGDNYETRFAYVDFGLPSNLKQRITLGLMPFTVNHYVWKETAAGIQYAGAFGPGKLTLAWVRGRDIQTTRSLQEVTADQDNYLLRGDYVPSKELKVGAFVLYQHQRPETTGTARAASYEIKRFGADSTFDIFTGGVDGGLKFGNIFVNFDGIYQGGTVAPGFDVSAFFAHADVGVNLGALTVTYTGWYASGDDDATDKDINNFMSTDVDMSDSVVLFEGGYFDETYFTEAPYFLTNGAIFNKIALDYKLLPNVTVGAAAMYIMSAEDFIVTAGGQKENVLGTEFDAYVSYKPYPQLELAINAGYLIAGDAMDAFEAAPIGGNGKADEDIFRSTARVRYIF